jgi:hypothetical protein
MPISEKPIAHLVWLQGRRAADDVEDYYEVARPGDKSVDGSDPFPVYAALPHLAKPVDGEPSGWIQGDEFTFEKEMYEAWISEGKVPEPFYFSAVSAALGAGTVAQEPVGWFNLPNDKHGYQQVSVEFEGLPGTVPLYAAPPPPAAVQEPVAVKAIIHIGAGMANTLYGLAQEDYIPSNIREIIKGQQQEWDDARSALSTSQSDPAPEIACPCTTFEQDEDCPVGQPSLLCSACEGKGVATIEDVVALAAEMMKVAEQVDELEDPFAAWESIELFNSHHNQMQKALCKIADMVDAEDADLDDAISIATAVLPVQDPPLAPEIAALPQDVINLVGAAREAFDTFSLEEPESSALDKALEPFSSRVPYENEPDDVPEQEEAK